MKIFFLKIILICSLILCKNIVKGQIMFDKLSYSDYLENNKIIKQIYFLLKEKRFNESIEECKKIKCKKLSCKDKYYLTGLSYYGINNINKSKNYILKALEFGMEPYTIKYNYLGVELPLNKEEIENSYEKYLISIDTSLRKKFNIKTDNLDLLNDYYSKNKWPGIYLLGHQTLCNNKTLNQKNIFNFLKEQNDSILIKYYPMIYKNCENYNENWNELENLIYFNLYKNKNKFEFIPLYFISIKHNKIDIKNSLLQLNMFCQFISYYNLRVKLFTSISIKKSKSSILLSQIFKTLVDLGINKDLVEISEFQIENNNNVNFYFSII